MTFHHFRYLILGIATLCCASILANMNIYNFAKICAEPIHQNMNTNYTKMNSHFTRTQNSLLQSASAFGALISSFPYLLAFQHFSGRYVFLSAGIISIVSTALVPLAFHYGFAIFFVTRIFQGIAFSTTLELMGLITHDWALMGEHGMFLAFLTGSTQLSNVLTMPLSGIICSSYLGWPWVYYIHAIISTILFTIWFLIYRDNPNEHNSVSEYEKELISGGKLEKLIIRDPVPYRRMFTDIPILSSWFSALADLLCVQLIAQYIPVYFIDYLHFNIFNSGFLSALPILAQFSAKLISGISSDAIKCVSITTNVKIYNSLALIASGGFMIILAVIPNYQNILCVAVITITVFLFGFNTAGFNKCITLRSRQHSHFAMSQIMNLWAITILIEPFIVEPILIDHTSSYQWMIVFLIHSSLAIFAGFVFVCTANATAAIWTARKESTIHKASMISQKRSMIMMKKLSMAEQKKSMAMQKKSMSTVHKRSLATQKLSSVLNQ